MSLLTARHSSILAREYDELELCCSIFPSIFCDVTEAWKLPNKNQRTIIALAGVVSTFGIAGLATSIYVITGRGMRWLAIAAIILYAESLLNFMPFIKLYGYIALMTYVDSPRLRDKTMEEWKYFLLLLVAGKCQQLKDFIRLDYSLV